MSRASEALFDELHLLTVTTLKAQIKSYTDKNEPVPPALLAQAIKMLKENGIDSPARTKDLQDTLVAELPNFDEHTDVTGVPH